ncbi:MAG TPA: hypothetical protein VEV82_09555, partial [Actinomycetota bacterium]|nr:hypothetical protein [Actinomycetota bacterium]
MATEQTELQPEEKVKKQASSRQIAMIVGAAVLLLIIFWFLFLRGGGGTEETLSTPPEPTLTELPGGGNGNAGNAGNGGNKPGDNGPVETTEVFASRDPFKPLLSSGGTDPGTSDTPTDTTTD